MVWCLCFQPEESVKNDVTPRERRKTETLARIDEIEVQVTDLLNMTCLSSSIRN